MRQTNEDTGKIMDDLHLDMCSHLHGSVPVSGLAVPISWSDFARSYRTNDFRGPGFRLSEKRWRFFKPREISSHRKFGPVDRRVSNVMAFDFRRRMECFAVFGLSSRVSSIRSSSLEIAEKYAKIEL